MLVTHYLPEGSTKTYKHSMPAVVSLVARSTEHRDLPRVFVDPAGVMFSVHDSEGSKALTRTEVYEREDT